MALPVQSERGANQNGQVEPAGMITIDFWKGDPRGDQIALYTNPQVQALQAIYDITSLQDPSRNDRATIGRYHQPGVYPIKPVVQEGETLADKTEDERRRSAMGDQVTGNLWDLLAVCKEAEAIVGISETDYSRYIDDRRGTSSGFLHISPNDPPLPDIRVEEFEGQRIYFPTQPLLDAFAVEKRADQPRNKIDVNKPYVPELGIGDDGIIVFERTTGEDDDLIRIAATSLFTGAEVIYRHDSIEETVRPQDASVFLSVLSIDMVEASIYSIGHSIKLVEQDRQDASIAPEDTNERLSRLHADLALYKALVQILHNNPYDPIERDPTQPKY